jgi:cytochrome b
MHSAQPVYEPAVAGNAHTAARPSRRVIDAPTRMFHWLFVLSFAGAYLSADSEHWRALHVTLGYTMAGLLGFRLLYGLFGPSQARLGALWRKLRGAPAWWRTLAQRRSLAGVDWRQGQNLAMALAVAALLVLVLPLTLSGYATYDEWGSAFGGDWLEEVHEFFGEAVLALVVAHLALVAGISLLRRRNQATPMLTGRVPGAGPDLVRRNRVWLAALLLIAVLTLVAWQWRQSPNGLIPTPAWSSASWLGDGGHHRDHLRDRHHDDD